MDTPLREQFIGVIMRFKKMDLCPPSTVCLQASELAVMGRASAGCVWNEKGVCVSEIQQALHISKPAVSQTLNGLERKGYIIRRIDPDDRRKITVTITPSGRVVLRDAQQSFDQTLNVTLQQFGDENTRTLVELMGRLMDILEDNARAR
ncbi:MAG: MarR family transcriptional regulator [Oscillospiraceae bacterium]|jgi:DNA-binding MarR family transcriptional regulator|nr:MarR family transcriptional regulator [Oscillospiraceae bacterium]